MLHCDGKCYLAKQLKKLEQEEKKNQPVPKMPFKLKENVWNSDSQIISFEVNTIAVLAKRSAIFFYPDSKPNSFSGSVFHPPAVA